MSYRDQANACPRCGLAIEQLGDRRKWRCTHCVGILVDAAEIEELGALLPRVRIDCGALACPLCGNVMESVGLAGIALDRCEIDRVVWCDRGELGAARAAARANDEANAEPESPLLEAIERLLY